MLCSLLHVAGPMTSFYVFAPNNTPARGLLRVKFHGYRTNHGNEYDFNTGVFTAKHAGIYYFAAQLRNQYSMNTFISVSMDCGYLRKFAMKIKTTRYEQIGAWNAKQTGSTLQVVLKLRAHNRCWISFGASKKVKLHHHSYFNGFLMAKF